MKAEHRKELHTNALADRMGRMVQQVKTGPSRRAVLWLILALIAVVVFVGWTIYSNNKRNTMSQMWADVGEDSITSYSRVDTPQGARYRLVLVPLLKEYQDANPGLAARYQLAWATFWEQGLKQMGVNAAQALDTLDGAEKMFSDLSEECKDDPVWGPEAAYALAVIQESRTVKERTALDKAITRYRGVQSKYKDSALGKSAAQRAEYLEKNRDRVEDFYGVMNRYALREQASEPPPAPVPILPKK